MTFVLPTNLCVRTDGSDTLNGGGSGSACPTATPSAPTVTPSASGGTIAAGTYYVVITIDDQFAETSKSAATTVVLTGATSSFVVTAPAAGANLKDWNVYVGTSATGPFWPQGTALVLGTNRSVTATPPTSGTQPPGTDYANQAAAQITYTDLVIDAVTNTKCTSVAHPFTADHVRNLIAITGGTGFTVQRVQILAVDAAGVATMDKTLGTLSSTGGTGGLGGALATPGMAEGLNQGGCGIFQKSGTYAMTNTTANVSGGKVNMHGGSNTGPRKGFWIGYGTTYNDGGAAPLNQVSGAIATFIMVTSSNNAWHLENVNFDGANKSTITGLSTGASFGRASRCKFVNIQNAAINIGAGSCTIEYCEITGCSVVACILAPAGADSHLYGCNIHGNSSSAISTGSSLHIQGCQFYNNSGASSDSILITSFCTVDVSECSFYSAGRNHINCTATGSVLSIVSCRNSVFEAATGWGATASQVSPMWDFKNCSFYNNASGEINTAVIPTYSNKTTLTGSPYTSPGSGDLSLNSTVGAGAACRASGSLGAFPGATSTGYGDRGAVQHADPAAGGGQTAYAFVS